MDRATDMLEGQSICGLSLVPIYSYPGLDFHERRAMNVRISIRSSRQARLQVTHAGVQRARPSRRARS